MESFIIIFTTVLLSVGMGFVALIVCLNLGIFPEPQKDEDPFAFKLYWRKPKETASNRNRITATSSANIFFNTTVLTSASSYYLSQREHWSDVRTYDEITSREMDASRTAGGGLISLEN